MAVPAGLQTARKMGRRNLQQDMAEEHERNYARLHAALLLVNVFKNNALAISDDPVKTFATWMSDKKKASYTLHFAALAVCECIKTFPAGPRPAMGCLESDAEHERRVKE